MTQSNADREYHTPKVTFRMPRKILAGMRAYCLQEGITLSTAFALLARGVVEGRVSILARDRQPWEVNTTGDEK